MSNITWRDAYAPMLQTGREIRPSQEILGQAIIDAMEGSTNLISEAATGTGKSHAIAVPLIKAIHGRKAIGKKYRGVISTETITLQSQICDKDLPELLKLYGGFSYKKLLGRSNYLCLNVAKQATVGSVPISNMVEKLRARIDSIGAGERADVERVLGKVIPNETWEKLTSSSSYCPDNQCSGEECFYIKARAEALAADIVVCNHAILATDIEMKLGSADGPLADGMLGQIDMLAVDEGHQLEPVLVSSWTKELTERELVQMSGSVETAIDLGKAVHSNAQIGFEAHNALEGLHLMLSNIKKFYSLLEEEANVKWEDSSTALSLRYVRGMPSHAVMLAMTEFEEENPVRIATAEKTLETTIKYLEKVVKTAREEKVKGIRKMSKGLRAAKELLDTIRIVSKALETKDGIISQYGIYGALVDGWKKRDGTYGMTIRLVPLDVSQKAKAIWANVKTNIMISATLTDLTDGSFKYAKTCVGFPEATELRVGTPFNLQEQQLIYITRGQGTQVEGARYDFNELIQLIHASQGRALVLFTSRKELDWAAEKMQRMRALGHFPYTLLVQEKDVDKKKLTEAFKSDTNSVLLATRSYFTGVDFSGETLSLVAMVKFPLARYSAECRQLIQHWRTRGFPNWYERESLTTFQQAAGRLIRSSSCIGVVGLLDFRLSDATSSVYKTALTGVKALGSPVTQDLATVQRHLS